MNHFHTFVKSTVATYLGVAYGVPAAYVFYQEQLGGKYQATRASFGKNKSYLFFPFYHPRSQEENDVQQLMRSNKGSVLVYGKPTTGKSVLVKRVCQDIGEGVCRVRPLKGDVFADRFMRRTNFDFEDRFTWENYKRNIRFPIDLLVPPSHCDEVEKFERCLKHFIKFVSENPRKDGNPWVLVIDEADRLSPFEFEMLRQTGDILGKKGVLTIVFVSSQAELIRLFYDRCERQDSKLLLLNGLNDQEARSFLESPECMKFVNHIRRTRNLTPLSGSDIDKCLEMCGGSPQWLLQAAINSPDVWKKKIMCRTQKIFDQTPKLADAVELLRDDQTLEFDTFVKTVGGANNAFTILDQGRDSVQECSPLFYDVANDTVSFCFPYHRACATNRFRVIKK